MYQIPMPRAVTATAITLIVPNIDARGLRGTESEKLIFREASSTVAFNSLKARFELNEKSMLVGAADKITGAKSQ